MGSTTEPSAKEDTMVPLRMEGSEVKKPGTSALSTEKYYVTVLAFISQQTYQRIGKKTKNTDGLFALQTVLFCKVQTTLVAQTDT